MNHSALCICIGADVHLDEIVLCVVDKADGHQVADRFRVTNNLPGAQSAATTIAALATGWEHSRSIRCSMTHRFPWRVSIWQVFQTDASGSEGLGPLHLADSRRNREQKPIYSSLPAGTVTKNTCQFLTPVRLSGKSVCQEDCG